MGCAEGATKRPKGTNLSAGLDSRCTAGFKNCTDRPNCEHSENWVKQQKINSDVALTAAKYA